MDQIEIHKLIDSICEGEPPTMFIAFCQACSDIREFEFGRCLECKEVWKPLSEYVANNKTNS